MYIYKKKTGYFLVPRGILLPPFSPTFVAD